MKTGSAEQLMQQVARLELVPTDVLHAACRDVGGTQVPAEDFGGELVRRELLTSFQLDRLLRGEQRGYVFGNAVLLYQIGAGSFSRVYRAVHRTNRSILAVKVLRKRFASDADKKQAFQHEGQMGRMLRHPNIVAIEDVGEQDGSNYLTMEFIEGQNLRELVRLRGALDLPQALDVIRQAANGLEHAHRRGVTHRDIKPSNLLVSATGQAKLVDFGLAVVDAAGDRSLGRLEKPRTIDYAALEKLTGMKEDGVRSDIYFLGTLAYLALSGSSALVESRDRAVRSDPNRYTSVESLARRAPNVPRDVVEVVNRMMRLDALERWQSAADVRRAIDQLIAKHVTAPAAAGAEGAAGDAASASRGSLMLVESAAAMQEPLRQFFTKLGYRVLLTESPERALSRFAFSPPADGLVLSALTLGSAAVDAFNALGSDPKLQRIPAILVLGRGQEELAGRARPDERRVVATAPLRTAECTKMLDAAFGRRS